MKKPTSKSASGTRKTSSPSGTSGRIVGTASIRVKEAATNDASEVSASIADKVRQMSASDFQESLVRSGIVTGSGKLKSKALSQDRGSERVFRGQFTSERVQSWV